MSVTGAPRAVTATTRDRHRVVTRVLYDCVMTNDQTMRRGDRDSAVDGGRDGVVREQMLPTKTRLRLQPEARLALAVLEDAAETLRTTHGVQTLRARRLATNAWLWVESDDTGHPFAFRIICQHLDLDGEWLRTGLARWRPVPLTRPSASRAGMAARKRRRAA